MENDLRNRAEWMARKLSACADDEQCAACAEECGVNDGTLLLAAAQTIRDLQERHMIDEGQAMLQRILRNAEAVDLTDAQK